MGDDDVKAMNEQWKTAKYDGIKSNDCLHSVDIMDHLEFESTYKYFVGLKVDKPIKMCVASNIVKIKWNKMEYMQSKRDIPLKVHSFRAGGSGHLQLLQKYGWPNSYNSAPNKSYKDGESEWIVFKLNNLYIPKAIIIKQQTQWNSHNEVKNMSVYIGDIASDKWNSFEPKVIKLSKESLNCQTIHIHGVDPKMIQIQKLQFIKIIFLENYGENHPDQDRYRLSEFGLKGDKA